MTAQVTDRVIYEGEEYEIVGLRGTGLFNPLDHGLEPVMIHTACYRGFYVVYAVEDNNLVLTTLTVQTKDGQYPDIGGITPEIDPRFRTATYSNLHLPVPFTGGLLIARQFIKKMYVHMGFQKPTSFKTVFELLLRDGRVEDALDFSVEIADIRNGRLTKEEARKKREAVMPDDKQLMDWIEWMFSLDYDWLL